jgi:predicted metalloprotease with PDZ domain
MAARLAAQHPFVDAPFRSTRGMLRPSGGRGGLMFRALKYLVVALSLIPAAAHARVEYAIDLTSPEHHLGQVSATFPATPGPYLDVKMPAWRTGRYTILDLANGVRRFTATDSQGRPLPWHKVDKSTWRIALARPTGVRIGYELYANELGLRTRHIDDSHAYLDASATFMYADRYRADDITVALTVPQGWKSFSGMRSTSPQSFVAANWDVLVDSPIESGLDRSYRFSEGDRDYEVVIWGDGNYDPEQVVADIRKIVPQASSIWSGYPFQRYVFMIHATDGAGGATEHRNSTVIQIPRWNFQPRARYLGFLSTTAHEFIHTWNVKDYRNAAMVPYDYQSENYTDLLWLEEGSTEYFADPFLLRAGLMKPQEYFEGLSGLIDRHRHKPGANEQSVAEASFDQWIATGGDRANNAEVDIYDEGQIASWMLDIALLQQTGGRVSYRDVHEALYKRFGGLARGFTAADVRAILKELTGTSWDQWWAEDIDAPAKVDFDALLTPVGLKLQAGPLVPWAGWTANAGPNGMQLRTVERGSPAWTAGFVPDDIIVAIDGKRVTADRFDAALGERKPGETVTVSYFRRDQLGEKRLTLGANPKDRPAVVPVEHPTPAQTALFQRWLLIPYPKAP